MRTESENREREKLGCGDVEKELRSKGERKKKMKFWRICLREEEENWREENLMITFSIQWRRIWNGVRGCDEVLEFTAGLGCVSWKYMWVSSGVNNLMMSRTGISHSYAVEKKSIFEKEICVDLSILATTLSKRRVGGERMREKYGVPVSERLSFLSFCGCEGLLEDAELIEGEMFLKSTCKRSNVLQGIRASIYRQEIPKWSLWGSGPAV
ncbi:hypothetical protein Tco_0153461 [Tanacetum coccineum]